MAEYLEQRELQGVGGWLAFLVFILGIASPARILVQTGANLEEVKAAANLLGPGTQTYVSLNWAIAAAAAAGSIYLAYRLLSGERWSAVRVTIIGLWTLATVPILMDLVASALLFPSITVHALAPAAIDLAKSSISATIWTAYLMKSKRVANTYVRDISDTERVFG